MDKKFVITSVLLSSIFGQQLVLAKDIGNFDDIDPAKYFEFICKKRETITSNANKSIVELIWEEDGIETKTENKNSRHFRGFFDDFLNVEDVLDTEGFYDETKHGNEKRDSRKDNKKTNGTVTLSTYGFIVNNNKGLLITNYFGYGNGKKSLKVKIGDNSYGCTFVGYDDLTGLSLYKVDDQDALKYISENTVPLSLNCKFKNKIYVYHFGINHNCKKTVKIKGKGYDYTNQTVGFCDLPHGLTDLDGNFVGLTTNKKFFQKNKVLKLSFPMDEKNENILYSGVIPVEEIKRVVDSLKDKGLVEHSYAGMTLYSLNNYISRTKGLKNTSGCFVERLEKNVEDSGINRCDVIVALNGVKVRNCDDFINVFSSVKNNDLILSVDRNGEIKNITIDAGLNADIRFVYNKKDKTLKTNGVTFSQINIKNEFGNNDSIVKISNIEKGIFYDKFNESIKDFRVESLNGSYVNSIESLKNAIIGACIHENENGKNGKVITITISGYSEKEKKQDAFSVVLNKEE